MSEHTPTPWKLEPNAYGSQFIYGNQIVESQWNGVKYTKLVAGGDNYATLTKANAALIVRAVNSHEALVKALEQIAAPGGCGCQPCVGQCKSNEALSIWKDEAREIASAALSLIQSQNKSE